MKKCEEIENNLPFYLDNSLPDAEKQAVEKHLNSCARCTKALVELSNTQSVVSNLAEVEPPPWFKQKIMSMVREEAERKSFVQKWFYPLKIKIPVQIFATVFVAVLAVYIYRAGEEQIKAVMPSSAPAPVMEISKNQLPVQSREAPETFAINVKKEKIAAGKDKNDEKAVMYDVSSGVATPKAEELKKARLQENVRSGELDAAKSVKENIIPEAKADRYASAPAAKPKELSAGELRKEEKGNILETVRKSKKTKVAQSVISKTAVALHVADVDGAAEKVEKLLAKYGSKNIVRQMTEDKAVLTAELKIQNMKDLMMQLKAIGRTEEIILPAGDSDGNIVLVIEILNN